MLINSQYQPSERKEMLEFITNNPKVTLEVGCREGIFSSKLREKFDIKECWGVEPDSSIEKKAQETLDKIIISYFNSEIELPEKYFDLVIFNDVLEHMYDPWEALQKTKELLTDDGIIIASIPNIRHKSIIKKILFNDDFTYERAGILDITHIRFFTKKTMVKLFEETGYEIIKVKPIRFEKKRKWYYSLKKYFKNILHLLFFNKFASIENEQYGFTLKVK